RACPPCARCAGERAPQALAPASAGLGLLEEVLGDPALEVHVLHELIDDEVADHLFRFVRGKEAATALDEQTVDVAEVSPEAHPELMAQERCGDVSDQMVDEAALRVEPDHEPIARRLGSGFLHDDAAPRAEA